MAKNKVTRIKWQNILTDKDKKSVLKYRSILKDNKIALKLTDEEWLSEFDSVINDAPPIKDMVSNLITKEFLKFIRWWYYDDKRKKKKK